VAAGVIEAQSSWTWGLMITSISTMSGRLLDSHRSSLARQIDLFGAAFEITANDRRATPNGGYL